MSFPSGPITWGDSFAWLEEWWPVILLALVTLTIVAAILKWSSK